VKKLTQVLSFAILLPFLSGMLQLSPSPAYSPTYEHEQFVRIRQFNESIWRPFSWTNNWGPWGLFLPGELLAAALGAMMMGGVAGIYRPDSYTKNTAPQEETLRTISPTGRSNFEDISLLYQRKARNDPVWKYSGMTTLMAAAFNSDLKSVQSRLAAADKHTVNECDSLGRTALMFAVVSNSNTAPEVISSLLGAGANVNVKQKNGATALMAAAEYSANPEIPAMLINANADVNAKDNDGETALMWGARCNFSPEPLLVLLKAGAELNARNKDNTTALMFAAAKNPNPDVILALLNTGADVHIKDLSGRKAIDYARENKSLKGTEALRLLEQASRP